MTVSTSGSFAMLKILEGAIRNHFLWKGRPLSRRGFFSLLFPFGRKNCPLCREARAVAGPTCATCAKRQLEPLKKLSLLILCFLAGLCGKTASAVDTQVNPSSYFFFSRDRNANASNQFYIPFYQYLDADLTDVGAASISLHASGWGRGDITSRGGDRGDGDLIYGYAQWQDPSDARRVVRVGRQFMFGGPAGLRTQYVDGLYARTDIVKGFGFEVLGGSPVISTISGRGGDFVAQGRNYMVFDNAEFGFGYLNIHDSSARSREDVGPDFWLTPFKNAEFYGYFYYDAIGHEFSDANLTSTFTPAAKWKVTADVSHTIPSALLSHTSFFSVFSTSSTQSGGPAVTWFASDRVTLDADARFFHYSDGGNLVRYGGQGSCRYGEGGNVSLSLHRLDQVEGGVSELRAFTRYPFVNQVTTSLDLYGYLFDEAIRGRDWSFVSVGSVGYELVKDLNLVGSLFYSENPLFSHEFRGLVKAVYSFGGKSNVF